MHEDLQPTVTVTAQIKERGIGAAVGDVRAKLDRAGFLPPGLRYELGGLYQQQQVAFAGLARVFAAALAAEFVLLLFLYRNLWLASCIVACALLSTVAVFAGLWVTGVELNVTALMGLTMVVGIGAEMAIFTVSEYAALAETMEDGAALRQASRDRLRPITMTTLAAILTLLPPGPGARPGRGHAAAAGHRHHLGPAAAISPGAGDAAGADRPSESGRRPSSVARWKENDVSIGWLMATTPFMTGFLASLVEGVEALTVILAVGAGRCKARSWRSAYWRRSC